MDKLTTNILFLFSAFHSPFSIFHLTSNLFREIKSIFHRDLCLLTSILLALYFLLPPSHSFAQTPEWVYQYVNPVGTDWLSSITTDSSGNTYTAGHLKSSDTTGGHISGIGVIKLNTSGQEQWIYFNDTLARHAYGNDIAFNSNKVYVAGYAQFLYGNKDLIVLCIDTLGNTEWIHRDTEAFEANAVIVASSQMVYIAGFTYTYSSILDFLVKKLDSGGNEVWRYIYNGPASSYDEAMDIAIDKNENIYVGGYSTGFGTSTDFTIIKLDSAGNEKWVYRYDGPASYFDELRALTIDTLGNVYGAGGSWSDVGSWDFFVVKLDSIGNEQWVYRYDGYAHYYDWAEDIVIDDSGFVYVCGLSYLYTNTSQYFAVIAIDSGGVEFWRYLTAGPLGYGGYPRRMVLDGLGCIYACGNLDGYLAVVKLSGLGNEEWVYKDPYAMIARGIVADIIGNIYVAGQRRVSQWNDDIVVMKFASGQGVVKEVMGNETIKTNSVATIFKGAIHFMPEEDCGIKVYDVMGRVVVNKILRSGKKESIKLQPGVHFLRVEEGKNQVTKKVIIL